MFKLQGVVKVVNPTVQISDKFSKREFVVTDNSSMYPQDILFQLVQDKCSLLDGINVNDQIEVSFNIRGREWTNPQGEVKYFNSLDAWRLDKVGAGGGMPAGGPSDMDLGGSTNASPNVETNVQEEDDDLPF
ncbi:MAG: DUF3127 domain-containing protein [Bacteroidetes bacterium]|nr:MAG: DUF3127 domain-containing protein [Bacteroidota bacterium]